MNVIIENVQRWEQGLIIAAMCFRKFDCDANNVHDKWANAGYITVCYHLVSSDIRY